MKLWLVFDNSGDEIDFDVVQPELTEFYINWLNDVKVNNFVHLNGFSNFDLRDRTLLKTMFDELVPMIKERFGVTCFDNIDLSHEPFDQDKLNLIHSCFVKSSLTDDSICGELSKDPELHKNFQMLNQGCHYTEKHWRVRMANTVSYPPEFIKPIANPFRNVTTFNVCNLSLLYAGLGRQTFDKWENNDHTIHDIDTHDFEELYGRIDLNLFKPRSVVPPAEYVQYCKDHGVVPHGTHIALGNVKNLETESGKLRDIFYNNFKLADNSARLEYAM